MLGRTCKWVAVLFLCGLLYVPAHALGKDSMDEEAFEDAEAAVAAKDWDDAMDSILTALTLEPQKRAYVDLLRTIAQNYFAMHEQAANGYREPGKIALMEDQCRMMRATLQRIEALGLTEGRGKKKKPMAIARPSDEMMALCEAAPQDCARTKYEEGRDYFAAEKYREAAIAFREAQVCVPDFEDAAQRYEECRRLASRMVGLLSISGRDDSTLRQLGDSIAKGITTRPTGAEFRDSIALDFIDFLDSTAFQSRLGAAGVDPGTGPVEIARKLQTQTDAPHYLLVVTTISYAASYPGLITHPLKKLTKNVAALVHEHSGAVSVEASYDLVEIKTGTVAKAGTVQVEEKDVHQWAEVGFTDVPWNGIINILPKDLEELKNPLAKHPEIRKLSKQPKDVSPLPEPELRDRAARSVAEKIKEAIKDAI